MMVIMDFVPFAGSIKNVIESMAANFANDTKLARDKGITALVTASMDLFGLCLSVGCIAYLFEKCSKIEWISPLKDALIMAVLIAIISIVVGAKIVAEQLTKLLIDNVVGVNTASASMVNSVTMTATGIEAVVETVTDATNGMVSGIKNSWSVTSKSARSVFLTPAKLVKTSSKRISYGQKLLEDKLIKRPKQVANKILAKIMSVLKAFIALLVLLVAIWVKAATRTGLMAKILSMVSSGSRIFFTSIKILGVKSKHD